MTSKNNIILAAFLIVAVLYLGYSVYATYFYKEHFVDGQHLNDYEARMHVMTVFDTVLKRKPTADEIDKYALITNEQDMLVAVLADYKALPPPVASEDKIVETLNPAPVPVAAAPAGAPAATAPARSPTPAVFVYPSADLKAIETGLDTINEMVTMIRNQLTTKVTCESEDSLKTSC